MRLESACFSIDSLANFDQTRLPTKLIRVLLSFLSLAVFRTRRNHAIADYLASNGFKESLEGFKREAQMVSVAAGRSPLAV